MDIVVSSVNIREFRAGDEPALHDVFRSAIHQIARADYTEQEVNAWAPERPDLEPWAQHMRELRPFVAEHEGQIVGYADVQPNGYIDHFFVSGAHGRQGIGTLLMNRLHQAAQSQGVQVLTSDVSLTAQPFFRKFGFDLIEHRTRLIRGVVLRNALMRKEVGTTATERKLPR